MNSAYSFAEQYEKALIKFNKNERKYVEKHINEDFTINWNDVFTIEKLDLDFIYKYSIHVELETIIIHQKMSHNMLMYFMDIIIEEDLWSIVITYQKIKNSMIEVFLLKDIKYWELVIIYQKLSNAIKIQMIKKISYILPEKSYLLVLMKDYQF